MPRARNIKPAFFMNDILAECEPLARILFIGLWTISDREGRLEDRPKKIKAETLAYDDCDVNALLNQLHKKGFIERYKIDNIGYIQIVSFTKHQNCHIKESASTIQAPDKHRTNTKQESLLTESLLLNPESLLLKEGLCAEQKSSTPPTPKNNRGTRLKEDWDIPDEWGEWSVEDCGWTVDKVIETGRKFKDHWLSVAGSKGVKLDWFATWRNWCRRTNEGF